MRSPEWIARSGAARGVMQRLENMPLRVRLVAIVSCMLAAALLLTSVATAYLMRNDLMDRVDTELRNVARPVTNQAVQDLMAQNTSVPTGYAFILQLGDRTSTVALNPTGESDRPDVPQLAADDPRVLTNEPFTVRSVSSSATWRVIAGTIESGRATFVVGIPLKSVDRTVTQLLVTTGLISAAVLALSLLLGWYAVRRAFRPLTRIEDTAAAIAKGDLSRRMPVRGADDEVASLTTSLNAMLAQIEASFLVREASEERMRQFVADASHELRTPLATMRGYAELYRQGAVRDAADVSSAMERIESESARMSGLVEDLLTLARLGQEPETPMGEVDLTVLAADAVTDARARAPQRRVSLVGLGRTLSPTEVLGSEPRLRQVVTNLLANALRYTPEGSPVEIAVGVDGPDGILEVRDHGPGIPLEERSKVFERFYRSDKSRGRGLSGAGGVGGSGGHARVGGSGLGLAIVAAIVTQHSGRVGVADTPGGGATFVVRLPRFPQPSELP